MTDFQVLCLVVAITCIVAVIGGSIADAFEDAQRRDAERRNRNWRVR